MEEEKNYTVYMHICKENNKTYVGITCQGVEQRWKNGFGYNGQHFGNAIKKYGWNNFEHIVLFDNKTKEEAELLEILFINILMSNNRNYGYNISNGGNSNGKHTEETKLKIKNSNGRKVICDGMVFQTLGDCAEFYNVNAGTMGDWLRGDKRMPFDFFELGLRYIDSKIELKPNLDGKGYSKKVICEGIVFESITACANHYNIDSHNMNDWLAGRLNMRNDFYEKGLRFLDEDNSHIQPQDMNYKCKQVICDNKVFDSVKDCAEFYNIKVSTMRCWLLSLNPMPQKFAKLNLRYLNDNIIEYDVQIKDRIREVVCDDKIFKNIKECSDFYNIKYGTMQCWLIGLNLMPQRFYNLGLRFVDDYTTVYKCQSKSRNRPVVCEGKVYKTVKECSIFYNINYNTMQGWLKGVNPMLQRFKDMGLAYYIEEENEKVK